MFIHALPRPISANPLLVGKFVRWAGCLSQGEVDHILFTGGKSDTSAQNQDENLAISQGEGQSQQGRKINFHHHTECQASPGWLAQLIGSLAVN